MSKIDLHIHSCFCDDGELPPRMIVQRSAAMGMELIAVTDHNSVRGVQEAVDAASAVKGLKVISGVELDCAYGGRDFHLLGYGFDHSRCEFNEIEQDILRQEQKAAPEKIKLFREATGIPIDEEEVMSAAADGVVPGELLAEILLAKDDARDYEALRPYLPGGEKSDMPNVRFYWDFFSQGKPAYAPVHYLSLPAAVSLIQNAGGVAVLAHPGQNLAEGEDGLLARIISEGIDGIEAFSSYHSKEKTVLYLKIARQNGLLVTCGSDFHGKHKPQIELGGHRASWEDRKIMAGLKERLPLIL